MRSELWRRYRDSNLRTNVLFCLILALNCVLLLAVGDDISIHYKEASGVFYSQDLAFRIARYSLEFCAFAFPSLSPDLALRAPNILLHLLNLFLMYRISRLYLKKPRDALIVALVYALLPGVIFSAIFVLKSALVICVTLLCCYFQMRWKKTPYPIMFVALFLDGSFAVLFLALFFHAIRNKNTFSAGLCLLFFALNMQLFGLDISGLPRNHFLSNLGAMALYFSPLLLLYYFYTLFNALKKQNSILVDIGATSAFFVVLLSLRQQVDLESLFPMSVVALPVAIRQFYADMRVRLPMFRSGYVWRFGIVLALLVAQSAVICGNKFLYLFGNSHFASRYHISKELAKELQERGIESANIQNGKLELSLRFYGIKSAGSPYLVEVWDLSKRYENEINIRYFGKRVASFVLLPHVGATPKERVSKARSGKELEYMEHEKEESQSLLESTKERE